MDLKKSISNIVLGVRFSRSFRIPDISGEIVDDILFNEKSPFDTSFFPNIKETQSGKILYNNETREYFKINTDDAILSIQTKDKFDEKIDWINEKVIKYLEEEVFLPYNIKNIKRIGIIFSHEIEKIENLTTSISSLTENKVTEVQNISVSFSKKLPILEDLFFKNTNNYKNTIYNFYQLEEGYVADLDYQHYFEPVVEDLRDCKLVNFITEAKNFLEKEYHPLISPKNKN